MSTATIYADARSRPDDRPHDEWNGVIVWMARLGLGAPVDGGRRYVSWVHGEDFVRAVTFLLERDDLHGPFIVAAPQPLQQRDFMRVLRSAWASASPCRPRG